MEYREATQPDTPGKGLPLSTREAMQQQYLSLVLERLRNYYMSVDTIGDGGATVKVCYTSKAAEYLKLQREDGSFVDVDYCCTESAANGKAWEPYLALDRMQHMAIAYKKPDHPHYGDPALLQGVEKGLLHWGRFRHPEHPDFEGCYSVNWWERDIGPQLKMGRIGLFLKDDLSPEALGVITRKLQKEGNPGTGQNNLWYTQNALFRALIVGDARKFGEIVSTCLTTKLLIQQGPKQMEAVQPDYSFHCHGALFFNNGYGMALFRDMSFWIYMLRDTCFALPEECIRLMADYMLKGTRWTIRRDTLEIAQGYTEIGDGGYAYNYYAVPLRRMIEVDKKNAREYQILLDNILGLRKDNGLSGFHYMWRSAYAAQMRPEYAVNVRMDSHAIKGAEWRATWPDKAYGNLVFWTTAGAVSLAVNGDEYTSIFPAFDWRHVPGTTAPFALSQDYNCNIAGDTAMGVSNGRMGSVGFTYKKYDKNPSVSQDGSAYTAGTIGYFFFDEEYVALGAGIESDSTFPIHTTINQTKGNSVLADGMPVEEGMLDARFSGRWVYNNHVGYVFLKDTRYCLSNLNHTELGLPSLWGTGYSQFSIDGMEKHKTYPVEHNTFTLYLDHGLCPKQASYSYVVLPGKTPVETATYAAALAYQFPKPLTVLANTTAVQAVKHHVLGVCQMNFYRAGSLDTGDFMVEVSAPCCLMVEKTPVGYLLSAAVPDDGSVRELTVSIDRKEVVFAFPEAPYTGKTITKAL